MGLRRKLIVPTLLDIPKLAICKGYKLGKNITRELIILSYKERGHKSNARNFHDDFSDPRRLGHFCHRYGERLRAFAWRADGIMRLIWMIWSWDRVGHWHDRCTRLDCQEDVFWGQSGWLDCWSFVHLSPNHLRIHTILIIVYRFSNSISHFRHKHHLYFSHRQASSSTTFFNAITMVPMTSQTQ